MGRVGGFRFRVKLWVLSSNRPASGGGGWCGWIGA